MAFSDLTNPVVLDGRVSDEKLSELLALQTEYPTLDFKRAIDLTTKRGLIELAKDVGAMQVMGGYIVAGVDDAGTVVGDMDGTNTKLFDEATLTPKLLQYLPAPLALRSRVLERDGHTVVLIFVGRHPSGCAIFERDGQYEKNGKPHIAFRKGDVFWRDGTRSVRITKEGFEEIIERRLAEEKRAWLEEHQQLRQQERAELSAEIEAAGVSRERARATLGAVNLDLDTDELARAVLELVRANDTVALVHLHEEALKRARSAIEREEFEELAIVLDKLTCLAATFLRYQQREEFERVIATLAGIYALPSNEDLARRYAMNTFIDPTDPAPRVWLEIISRVYALGALAVRTRDWRALRTLTLQRPEHLTDYDANWLRHAITMISRAQHLKEQQSSLLSVARTQIDRLECLRADGIEPESDAALTSLAQFDLLSNVVAIDGAADATRRVFYTNFARFRQERIQPIADKLIADPEMRAVIFPREDAALALALHRIGQMAHEEGFRYDGFWGWNHTPVGEFIEQHLPPEARPQNT